VDENAPEKKSSPDQAAPEQKTDSTSVVVNE
jgi:hypothetical protein